MALFSQGNLEAVNNKIRICTKCHQTLIFSEQDGFCCPICHRCWLPQDEADKTYTHPAAVYRGGAVVYKGTSKGRKRKKPPKKTDWAGMYGDS